MARDMLFLDVPADTAPKQVNPTILGRSLMSSVGYHEPVDELSVQTRDMHRAIVSLMEELEAIDWYNQRVEACTDKNLKVILEHNRDEEKEHASMLIEWIRRADPCFSKEIKNHLLS